MIGIFGVVTISQWLLHDVAPNFALNSKMLCAKGITNNNSHSILEEAESHEQPLWKDWEPTLQKAGANANSTSYFSGWGLVIPNNAPTKTTWVTRDWDSARPTPKCSPSEKSGKGVIKTPFSGDYRPGLLKKH
jgi:hypothetical protein